MSSRRGWAKLGVREKRIMHRGISWLALAVALFAAAEPAFAHHVMGGKTPDSFITGLLSGLGHPVIGIDHLAAVVAVGCLAAAHRAGALLAVAFVVAMMCGVAVHLQAVSVPADEILVAVSVILLGAIVLSRRDLPVGGALALFVLVGLIHGYALGESIFGAERTPLAAYLIGLAGIQSAVALAAMTVARVIARKDEVKLRLVGAGIAGIGLAVLVQQLIPAPPA
jgi:urease accessory protein